MYSQTITGIYTSNREPQQKERKENESILIELRLSTSTLNKRCLEIVQKLYETLKQYKDWTDPTSIELHEWGMSLLKPVLKSDSTESDKKVIQLVKKQLIVLETTILDNFVDHEPLVHPVLEREWLWEECRLKDYRTLNDPCSPFDNHLMEISRPHSFAEAVLKWSKEVSSFLNKIEAPRNSISSNADPSSINSVPTPTNSLSTLNNALIPSPPTTLISEGTEDINPVLLELIKLNIELKKHMYYQRAKEYCEAKAVNNLGFNFINSADVIQELNEQAFEYANKQREIVEREMDLNEKKMHHKIQLIEQTYEQSTTILHGRLDHMANRLDRETERSNHLEHICQSQKQSISQISYNLRMAEQELNALRHNINKPKKHCIIS